MPTVANRQIISLEGINLQRINIQFIVFLIACLLIVAACTNTGTGETPPTQTAVSTPTTATNSDPTASPAEITANTTQPPEATAANTAVPTEPAPTPVGVVELPGATVPPGFSFVKFADIFRPTGLTFDAAGRLFVTSFDGTVHILQDVDGDGRSDSDVQFAAGFSTPLGITLRPNSNDVYVSSTGQITLLRDENRDDVADVRETLVSGLPTGLHQNDNLKFGADGWLYMGIGSTCDVCDEADDRSATIMRFNVDSGESEIIAIGLRNPYDLAFHPATGDLFATDNGRDDLGLGSPFEELNHIVVGGNYGWPGCWNDGEGSDCAETETAVAFFDAHASANGLDFYTGDAFPAEYQNNAFVAIFGTFLTDGVPTGVARVQLSPSGESYTGTVSWFAQWPDARPLPLIAGPDGAIYVGDYLNSVIYRISYGN
ncbi:DUF7133 domain-containing protein [Candidatus Leptofilum sp.]|uniref:PQQ-dependent sugar dehydrogenase n=1 Tax=Candidatus Leptofilum sp. TaxID=3241576 RepID=UPI003B59735F